MKLARPFLYAVVLLLPAVALAQGSGNQEFVPLLPSLPGISSLETANKTATFLTQIYKICIGAAAVIAVLQIMRAGVLYMGGDSFTEKEQARSLISTSIVGLLLVLSPVIVFSIINPKILELNIDTSSLGTDVSGISNHSTDAVDTTKGDGSCSFNCTAGNTCQSGKCVAVQTTGACSAIANGAEITDAQFACCNKQSGYSVQSAVKSGGNGQLPQTVYKCVLTQAAPAPKPTISYGWRGRFVPKDQPNAVPSVQQQGPFTTQAACQASMTDWPLKNNLSSTGEYTCTCNSPTTQQPSCTGF